MSLYPDFIFTGHLTRCPHCKTIQYQLLVSKTRNYAVWCSKAEEVFPHPESTGGSPIPMTSTEGLQVAYDALRRVQSDEDCQALGEETCETLLLTLENQYQEALDHFVQTHGLDFVIRTFLYMARENFASRTIEEAIQYDPRRLLVDIHNNKMSDEQKLRALFGLLALLGAGGRLRAYILARKALDKIRKAC